MSQIQFIPMPGGGGGGVTAVTGSIPLESTGGTTPVISIGSTFFSHGALFINAQGVYITGSLMISGTTDLYTVPAGKRFYYQNLSTYNTAAGSNNAIALIKSGTNYYNLGVFTNTAISGTSSIVAANPFILEANEVISILTNRSGLNCWAKGVLFDNNSNLKTARNLDLVSGINTVYVCPNGKTALIGDASLSLGTAGGFFYSNYSNAVTSGVEWYIVPNGQTYGPAFLTRGFNLGSYNNSTTNCSTGLAGSTNVLIKIDNGSISQHAWVNVIEL